MRTIFSILFSVIILNNGFTQDAKPTWDFPVKPGSEKWKSLKSHREMVAVCQIPNEIIYNLSTQELVLICLDYPLFFTITAFNNMQQGFDQNRREFNGFTELFKRKDAGKVLIKIYSEVNPSDVNLRNTDLEKGMFKFRIFYLEILLAQTDLLKSLSTVQQKDLLKECIKKVNEKSNASFSGFQMLTTHLIMARTLLNNQVPKFLDYYKLNKFNIDLFVYGMNPPGSGLMKEIQALTKNFISIQN
jgi:hypothetical protein